MLSNRKLVSAIFSFVITANCYASSTVPRENEEITDTKLKNLLNCLTSAGVDEAKIHPRDHKINCGNKYSELNFQWNTLNGYITPLAYLVATDVSDIQKAVVCSRSSKVRIVPRSGGHSYVKNGFGDSRSLIVDLATINQISLDSVQRTCQVGSGARNGLISYKLWENGFVLPQGICPSVGIAGLTLGGGWGHLSRLYGLTLDNVLEMEMVDAKGKLLTVNNTTNADLFWALRGGGGGSYGIVTNFKFKMYPAPKSFVYGAYEYNFDDFERFYTALQRLISGASINIFCYIGMEGNLIEMKLVAFNGPSMDKVTVDSLDKLRKSWGFPVATKGSTKLLSYSEFLLAEGQFYSSTLLTHPSQLANMTRHNHVYWKKVKSIFVDKLLRKNEIFRLKELLSAYLPYAGLSMEVYGGAINTIGNEPLADTSFIHRGNNLYNLQLKPLNSQGTQPNAKADWVMKTFYEKSKTIFHHRESYQNYLDQDIPDYLTRYYGNGSTLKKLVQVKKRIDPANIFHHPQSIPVELD